MKNLMLSVLFLGSFAAFVQAQDSVFYYDEWGGKIYLQKENNAKIICFKDVENIENNRLFKQLDSGNIKKEIITSHIYKISEENNQKSISNVRLSEYADSNVLYISDILTYNGASTHWESDKMIVKIFPDTELSEILRVNNIPYKEIKRLGSNPQIYIVTLDVSKKSSIEYANSLVENKSVVVAQPSLFNCVRPSNPYFPLQWALHNTGTRQSLRPNKAADFQTKKTFFQLFSKKLSFVRKKIVSLHFDAINSVSLSKFLTLKCEKFQKRTRITMKTLDNAGWFVCSNGIFSQPQWRIK
jgi:hypothetical protein